MSAESTPWPHEALCQVMRFIELEKKKPNYMTDFVGNNEEENPYVRGQWGNPDSDVVTLSKTSSFPTELALHYSYATKRVSYGCLAPRGRFYAIVDNKLFLWRTTGFDTHEQIQLTDAESIATACCFKAGPEFIKTVDWFLAVATSHFVRIYIVENDNIHFDRFFDVDVDFVIQCMCSGRINELILGANNGNLYRIQWTETDKFQLVKGGLCAGIKRHLSSLLSLNAPIASVYYEETRDKIATVGTNGEIKFWDNGDSLSYKSKYHDPSVEFVCLSPVPKCESNSIYFIGFTSEGERYFFGTYARSDINIRGKLPPANEFRDRVIVSGWYSLGFYTFLTEDSIYTMRSDVTEQREVVAVQKIEKGHAIAIFGKPNFGELLYWDVGFYNDPFTWQHFQTAPAGYILTTDGSCSFQCHEPYVTMRSLLLQEREAYSMRIDSFMSRYFEINTAETDSIRESLAMAIILADRCPEMSDRALTVAHQFMKLRFEEYKADPNDLTIMTEGFYIHAARLMALISQSAVFETKFDGTIKVAYAFKSISTDVVKRMASCKTLMQRYIEIVERDADQSDDNQRGRIEIEKEQLGDLAELLDYVIEFMKLISILTTQRSSLLAAAVAGNKKCGVWKDGTLSRLMDIPFMVCDTKDTTIEDLPLSAMRSFIKNLLTVSADDPSVDFLASKICSDCPKFAMTADVQIEAAMKDLERMSVQSDTYAPLRDSDDEDESLEDDDTQMKRSREDIIRSAIMTLMFFSEQPLDIRKICSLLFSMDKYKEAVEIACTRASHIDPVDEALYWFKNGCDMDDEAGHEKYQLIYNCYESLFEAMRDEHGKRAVLETNNELLHVIVFHKLIKIGEHSLLFSLDSPFLKEYIEENARELLWQYYVKNNNYEEAVIELIGLATNARSLRIDKRVEYLEIANNKAKLAERVDLEDETKFRLKCARIQHLIHDETGEFGDCGILELYELIAEAEQRQLWKICLQIYDAEISAGDLDERRVKQFWQKYVMNEGRETENETEQNLRDRLVPIFHALPPSSPVMDPTLFVPAFEDLRMSTRSIRTNRTWVPSFLIGQGISGSRIYNAYADIITDLYESNELTTDHNELIYIAVWLLRSYTGNFSRIAAIVDEVVQDDSDPYVPQIKTAVESLSSYNM